MAGSNVGSLAIGMLLMCVVAFLPTYVEAVMGRSAGYAGIAVATLSVSWSCRLNHFQPHHGLELVPNHGH